MYSNDEIEALMLAETGGFGDATHTVHYKNEDDAPVVRKAHVYVRPATTTDKRFSGYGEQETIRAVTYRDGSRPYYGAIEPLRVTAMRAVNQGMCFADPEASRQYDNDGSVRPSIDNGFRVKKVSL